MTTKKPRAPRGYRRVTKGVVEPGDLIWDVRGNGGWSEDGAFYEGLRIPPGGDPANATSGCILREVARPLPARPRGKRGQKKEGAE